MKIMKRSDIKKMYNIWEKYGIDKKFNYNFFANEDKIYITPKGIDLDLLRILNVKGMGLYIGRFDKGNFVFSIEGTQLIGKYSKNTIHLNDEQVYYWQRGQNFETDEEEGYYLLEYKNMIVGWAKVRNKQVQNNVEKERVIRRL